VSADLARPSVRPRRRCTYFDFEDEDDWSTLRRAAHGSTELAEVFGRRFLAGTEAGPTLVLRYIDEVSYEVSGVRLQSYRILNPDT
jgi:hypothetical protein